MQPHPHPLCPADKGQEADVSSTSLGLVKVSELAQGRGLARRKSLRKARAPSRASTLEKKTIPSYLVPRSPPDTSLQTPIRDSNGEGGDPLEREHEVTSHVQGVGAGEEPGKGPPLSHPPQSTCSGSAVPQGSICDLTHHSLALSDGLVRVFILQDAFWVNLSCKVFILLYPVDLPSSRAEGGHRSEIASQ